MRVCVFGAGAVGGNFAARLAAAGNDVSVVARGETLAAIKAEGITVIAGDERIVRRVRASDRPADLGAQDVVISTLKANALDALAAGIGPLLHAGTTVVFAQNGIPWWYGLGVSSNGPALPDLAFLDPGAAIATAVGAHSIMAGAIYSANSVVKPGVIDNASPTQNKLLVANIDDTVTPPLAALRRVLEAASIESPSVANIRQVIWQKLLSNMVTGMTVLVEEPTSEMLADSGMVEIARRLITEVVVIGAAYGIEIESLMPSVPRNKKSSILQDFERHRPMEVAAQYLAPLAFARAAGIDAPILATVATTIAHRAAVRGLYSSGA